MIRLSDSGIFAVMAGLTSLVLNCAASAQDCQQILNDMRSIGPGYGSYERAMQLGNYYNSNCVGQHATQPAPSIPQIQQASPQPPLLTEAEQAVIHAFERLGAKIMQGAPLPEGAQLSSSLGGQSTPAPPKFYKDPFETSLSTSSNHPSTTPTKSTGGYVDPFTNKEVQLTPPNAPASTSRNTTSAQPGTYAACVGGNTFNSSPAYCEMGGYVYFKNGNIMKAQ